MNEPQLIMVDDSDSATGTIAKTEAHLKGILHRAFSVFLFTGDGRWILQRRALTKYHSPGLWSNTCCGHPAPGEDTAQAALSRLKYEMGLDTKIQFAFSRKYFAALDGGMIEHELDHVFTGMCDDQPVPRQEEVIEVRFLSEEELRKELRNAPEQFTAWLRILFEEVLLRGR
jgi:isopentenyl-diphosphate Delta-isomerase